MDLITRRIIAKLEGSKDKSLDESVLDDYSNPETDKYACMLKCIRDEMKVSSLKYQKLQDMIGAIGLPADNVCTYCWNGRG